MEMYRKLRAQTEDGTGRVQDLFVAMGITILVAALFYHSGFALVLFFPIYVFYRRYSCEKRRVKERSRLLGEFQSCMEMLAASLLAGYALENAFIDAQKELQVLYGEESIMCRELERMNRQIAMNQPLERVFAEFAVKHGVEEIINFSEILSFAKRSGGDFVEIMQRTVENIGSKIRLEEEIQTMIAQKKMEQKVMNVMPVFLLIYLDITSPGYLDVLYGNLLGVVIMTACLLSYAAAVWFSERMANIEV